MRSHAALLLAALVLIGLPALVAANHVALQELREVLPRDAIPAVRMPNFAKGDYLDGRELVIGLEIDSDARAYPVKILNHHEIVNDVVGGVPVAVTFCPLCNTAIVYDRAVGGQILTFGVSGLLFKSNLVMYDEETESFWIQITSEAVQGPLHGTILERIPATVIEWNGWKERYPESLLLDYPIRQCEPSREGDVPIIEGFDCIDYNQNPYGGYIISDDVSFGGVYDDRILHPKSVVLGVKVDGEVMAFPYETLAEEVVINDRVGSLNIVVAFYDSSAKAFERGDLTFEWDEGRFMVDNFGRRWDMVTGEGVGVRLEEVTSTMSFWFAWAEFNEGSGVYGIREPLSAERQSPLVAYTVVAALAIPAVALYFRRRGKVPREPPEKI
ncbi:MAG: DUF3179 domain-containing protein [Thermoplasmata archaeon]